MPTAVDVQESLQFFKDLPFEKKAEFLSRLTEEDMWFLDSLGKRLDFKLPADRVDACRASLWEFVKEGWKCIEGSTLAQNWHQQLICEYLEAQFYEPTKYQNVLINIQPRVLKSMICSVFFPCWVWLHRPHTRFLCISYASSLSNNHNFFRRLLIQTSFYQQLCKGKPVKLTRGKNRISEFSNTSGGEMISRGLDGSVTGVGGDHIIVDDPNDPEKVESEVKRTDNVTKCKNLITTRKNFPNAPVLIIQQRTHRLDVSGWVLKSRPEFKKLILPTRVYETQIVYFPRSQVYKKRLAGTMLHESWFGPEHEKEARDTVGPEVYAARFQQEPVPPGGGIIKSSYFGRYTHLPAYPEFWVGSWDTAQKKEETNKPWAGICACLWKGRIYITDFYMNWHEYPDGERAVVSLAEKWRFGREPHALLIEDKSTGSTLIQRLRSEEHLAIKGFSVIGIKPDGNLDKIGRMTTEAPMIAGGRVYLPESAPWLPELEELLMSFPQSEFMDPIDALSQLLMWVRTTGISYYDRSIEDRPAHE